MEEKEIIYLLNLKFSNEKEHIKTCFNKLAVAKAFLSQLEKTNIPIEEIKLYKLDLSNMLIPANEVMLNE